MTKLDVPTSSGEKSLISQNNPLGIIPSEQIIPFKERLKEVIGNDSIMSFARKCNLSDKTLRDYMSGKSYPTLDRLALIAEASGRNISWLATGIESAAIKVERVNELIHVPQYDLRASAGTGCLVVSETPIAEFSFSKEWLISQGLNGAKLSVVPVYGDSMEPTLVDEDLMLVKLIDDPREGRDGVCVIRIDDEIMVKRIQYDFMKQGYYVRSDNSAYSPFFIEKEELKRFHVIGRMVRVLQRAKQTPVS
ncbi:hypothetical protein C9J12_08135 [Photobacterium frigidiphilum]|uniref:HTH cro/C1-type domain-containing protein n=1 Tax=Photobacterium frigidiphilum TaxID=264736 RepID=A0A2T3JKG5_9GAMM|nr:S24 family peptidase [Photobacterium frigidiphilum]PSU49448.1 hypothetical protein C9J12_08135 [Photobacterium frigidiphilum]